MAVYADLFRYRELFNNLFQRELRVKYKGSLLGVGWTLVYPLILMGVYTVVFSVLWTRIDIPHYPLFLLSGLVVWVFFSGALQAAARSLIDSADLIKKVRFPRQLVPLSVVATQLVSFAVMLGALIAVNVAVIPEARDTAWLALPLSLPLMGLVAGVTLAVASANVLFRDVEHVVGALLLPWFFLTPILFPLSELPGVETHHTLVTALHYANFMWPPIDAIRDPLFYGRLPTGGDVAYLCGAAVVALALGGLVFSRVDDQIAVEL